VTITHVSDTARWVAVYRAMESERPDALFQDPFARRLAGPEGERIVATMKQGRSMAWAMIVRTAVFDELILASAALLARLGAEGGRTLAVTEGLLIYLDAAQVSELGRDLAAVPGIALWLIDLASPLLLQWMQRSWGRAVAAGNAPFRFAPPESVAFFRPLGWSPAEERWASEESHRLHREMRLMWLWRPIGRLYPKRRREAFRRMSGFVLLERAS